MLTMLNRSIDEGGNIRLWSSPAFEMKAPGQIEIKFDQADKVRKIGGCD